jgi:thiol-disulfide isomerase/thioredoxin
MKKTIFFITLFILIFGLLSAEKTLKTQKMMNFKLQDLSGKTYELNKMLGKGPIIIDFWATWCEPCLKELPDLSKLQTKYEDKLTVIAISVDKARKLNQVKREVKSHRYKFITLFDKNGAYQKKLNIRNIPQTYLLDKNGNIVYHHEGFDKNATKLLENALIKLISIDTKTSKKKINNDINHK